MSHPYAVLKRIGLAASLLGILASVPIALAQQRNEVDPSAISVPDGYAVEAAVTGLSVPTTAIFDGEDLIVAESGFLGTAEPRILRVTPSGETRVIASEGLVPPVTGLLVADGTIYVSHKTKVSRVVGGKLQDVVTGLPSLGDHQNNNIVLGQDGRIYVGQGTATNSGVVGIDNDLFGWLKGNPAVHDIPCRDVTLTGKNFETGNPLTEDNGDEAVTGAYQPFGTPSSAGEVVTGQTKCNGAILSFRPDGSDLRVVAWGMRNPFGLALDAGGNLWATFHGADSRGSRAVYNDADYLVRVKDGGWYGWPDYFKGKPATDEEFDPPGTAAPTLLLQDHPPLERPFAMFDSHAAANGLAFSPSDTFGFPGQAFVALYGTFAPLTTGPNVELSGFSVAQVDPGTGQVATFAENRLPGPAYLNRQGGFNRPSDIVFGPDDSMYVVDWGAAALGDTGLELKPQTGIVWRIYNRGTQQARYAEGPIVVPADPTPDDSHEPLVPYSGEALAQFGRQFWPVILVVVLVALGWLMYRRTRKS